MIKIKLTFISIILFTATAVHALGIGAYTTGKAGISNLNPAGGGFVVNYGVGAGFVLDTAVASSSLFNYRLAAGYENTVTSGTAFFKKYGVNQVTLNNAFGFGLVMKKYVRVWMGPQVVLGCLFLDTTERKLALGSFTAYTRRSINFALFSLGIGAVLGVNINTGKVFTISLECGLNTLMALGRYRVTQGYLLGVDSGFGTDVVPLGPNTSSYDRAFGHIECFSRLSFIFRVGDMYEPDILLP
jgi:hypothetical protein